MKPVIRTTLMAPAQSHSVSPRSSLVSGDSLDLAYVANLSIECNRFGSPTFYTRLNFPRGGGVECEPVTGARDDENKVAFW